MKTNFLVLAATTAIALSTTVANAAGDPVKGKIFFGQQCMLCHSSVAGAEGSAPSLFGVVGRRAGSEKGFTSYSTALKTSGIVWTAPKLDQFLSGPATLVPGTAMPITVADPQARQNVIAYLASLKR